MSEAQTLEECSNNYRMGNYEICKRISGDYLSMLESSNFNERSFDILYYRGMSCYELGTVNRTQYLEALKAFEILLEKYSIGGLQNLDEVKIGKVKERSRNIYDSDRTLDEINCRVTFCLAYSLYIGGQFKSAINLFEAYLENIQLIEERGRSSLEYTTIKALHYKGLSHMREEQHIDAINCFLSELRQLDVCGYANGSYRAMFNIGLSYFRLNQNKEALHYFTDSLFHLNFKTLRGLYKFEADLISIEERNIEFEEDDTNRHIAIAYSQLGDNSRAIFIYKWIKAKYNNRIIAFKNRLVNATETEKKTIYNDPVWNLFFAVRNNLAMIYAEQGQFDEAEKEIDFVNKYTVKESYMKSYMVDTKGYVLYKKGDHKEALKYFDKAVQMDPPIEGSQRPYWFHKGNCYLRLKENDDAIDCYNSAEKASNAFDDNLLDVLNNKAVAYHNKNEKDQAISNFKRILKLRYNYIPAHHNLLKLSLSEPRYSSFWSYWQDSRKKKWFAGALVIAIFSIISITLLAPGIYSYFPQPNRPTTTENTTNIFTTTRNSSGEITTNTTTTITKPSTTNTPATFDIPLHALIAVGILALVLLSPIIKSASIGTTAVELTTVDRAPEKHAELEFIEK